MDHTDVVQQVKASLEAKGVTLTGPDGAFAITKRVAWRLRAEGAGLLDKPAGNNSEGFATDIICYPDGALVDILGDGGGANTPMWRVTGEIRPTSQYRAAIDPGDDPIPQPGPQPGPGVPAPSAAIDALAAKIDAISALLTSLDAKLDTIAKQGDANTEKLQQQIDQAVNNIEKTASAALPLLGGLLGGKR